MNTQISLTVNGQPYSLSPIPGETLSALLRERLRLTGTKIGCEESECGACTVLIDGEPILSCMYPAERAAGKTIVTIEGLAGEFTAKNAKQEEKNLGDLSGLGGSKRSHYATRSHHNPNHYPRSICGS